MFCSKCGAELQPRASYCNLCGRSTVGSLNSNVVEPVSDRRNPSIWNPNAAANWSLIFTPAFGAYLQMRNWQALGETENAASARAWFYVSLGMLGVYILMGVFMSDSDAADGAARGLGVAFLLAWYFSSGRVQVKFVKQRFGKNYSKKPWGKALLIAIGGIVGYLTIAVVAGIVLAVLQG